MKDLEEIDLDAVISKLLTQNHMNREYNHSYLSYKRDVKEATEQLGVWLTKRYRYRGFMAKDLVMGFLLRFFSELTIYPEEG